MDSMKSADTSNHEPRRERASLDGRYGKIGISAVAAACRHQRDDDETPRVKYTARFVETD